VSRRDLPPIGLAQQRYARVLEWGARLGFVVLVVAFALYATGLLSARIPLDRLDSLWSLPLGEFLERTGTPTGLGWMAFVGHGDFASLAGIAILAFCSVPCVLAVAPLFARGGDRTHAILCLLQAGVLVLAASGLLSMGH